MTRKQVNIRLDKEVIEALKTKADSQGKTFTDLILDGIAIVLGDAMPANPRDNSLTSEQVNDIVKEYIYRHVQPQLDEQATRLTQLTNGARLQGSDHRLESIAITQGSLESLTRDELRKLARKHGIKNPDNKRKSQLIDAIMSIDSH